MQKIERKLLIATNNAGKLREFKALLVDFFARVVSPADLGIDIHPEETGTTFSQNARIKSEAFLCAAPDCWVLADDSGLCVDALNGAPGVYSARYADERGDARANNEKLLRELTGVKERSAYFETCLCLMTDTKETFFAAGRVKGHILEKPDGAGGFGYDPIFFSSELGQSFGAVSESLKNTVSHRARAIDGLKNQLDKFCQANPEN